MAGGPTLKRIQKNIPFTPKAVADEACPVVGAVMLGTSTWLLSVLERSNLIHLNQRKMSSLLPGSRRQWGDV